MKRRLTPLAAGLAVSALALGGGAMAQQGQADEQMRTQQSRQAPDRSDQNRSSKTGRAPMEYQQVRGTIIQAKQVRVKGSQTPATLVLLELENGRRAVVDLGTERLGVRLNQGDELMARGRPVDIGRQRVVLQANAVRINDRAFDINRPALRRGDTGTRTASADDQRRMGQGMGDRMTDQDAQRMMGQQQMRERMAQMGQQRLDQQRAQGQGGQQGRQRVATLFNRWDRDSDGNLTLNEWDRGVDQSFGEQAANLDPSDWDRDGDGRITRQEFQTAFAGSELSRATLAQGGGQGREQAGQRQAGQQGRQAAPGQQGQPQRTAADIDRDQDGRLSRTEFTAGIQQRLDRDGDNRISQVEFRRGAARLIPGGEGLFSAWDQDGDTALSRQELTRGIADEGLFDDADLDGDGLIDQQEYASAEFLSQSGAFAGVFER